MKNEEYVDDVLRKIGRNVVLFQQLEHLLKFIVANIRFAGFVSQIRSVKQKKDEKTNRKTMGTLVGHYIENLNPLSEPSLPEPEKVDESYYAWSFKFGCDDSYFNDHKQALEKLVSERNDLIHHLLSRVDINCAKSCETLSRELDEQADNIRSQIRNVGSYAREMQEMGQYLQSEAVRKGMEQPFLRQSRLVEMLSDFVNQTNREDGWASVSAAGQAIKRDAPKELEQIKERFGYDSLKKLILGTEMFDVHEELTPKGGVRILYRLKPEWDMTLTKH